MEKIRSRVQNIDPQKRAFDKIIMNENLKNRLKITRTKDFGERKFSGFVPYKPVSYYSRKIGRSVRDFEDSSLMDRS